jgi:hypothetical protein
MPGMRRKEGHISGNRSQQMGNPLLSFYRNLTETRKGQINDYLAILKKFGRLLTELRFAVYEDLEGHRFSFVTSQEPDTNFIESVYPGATVTRVGTLWAWNLRSYTRRHEHVIIDMHTWLARFFPDGIISFSRVRQAFDCATPFESLFSNKDMKRERRRVEKFEPVFSKDPEDLRFFYEKMYLPFVHLRHDDVIILKQVFMLRDLKKNGELCLVKKDGNVVAGQFCNQTGDTYSMLVFGLVDESFLKEGAGAALYYYCIQRALGKGARYVDFGLSKPFIADGVVGYKRKWGGRIQRDHETRHVLYLKNITPEGLVILEGTSLKVLASPDNDPYRDIALLEGMEVKFTGDAEAA